MPSGAVPSPRWNLAHASWSIAPGAQTDPASLYGYQTYTRSAQFWAALRVAIGEEVDHAVDDADGAWECYLRTWRPGKPHPETWAAYWHEGWSR